jgi:uncharacterized protein DUF6602
MSTWSLARLLAGLHDDIEHRLKTAREAFNHSGTKGDASEHIWLELLRGYLPQRYCADKAHVVDSNGVFSQQIDVVVYDRQYSPLVFKYEGQIIIPAESVYAVFEAKQVINAAHIDYAHEKTATVRRLQRTSLPIPHAGGTYAPRLLPHILGGILTFESDWSPPLGEPLIAALKAANPESQLDIGCVAAHGMFTCDDNACHAVSPQGKPATAFLLELIAQLQSLGTVPMIDTRAYARWLV